MKVLIIDDNRQRSTMLENQLIPLGNLIIDKAESIKDALSYLRNKKYNSVILDIALPRRSGEQPISDGGLEIFEKVRESDMYFKPDTIIGLTAHDSLIQTYSRDFESVNWRVIKYDGIDNSWLEQITGSIKYFLDKSNDIEKSYSSDIVVITVTQMEFDSFMNLGIEWSKPQSLDDSTYYLEANLTTLSGIFNLKLFKSSRMGMIDTSILSTKIINLLRPKIIVMAGICAGIAEKTEMGDVILASPAWDWQSGKHGLENGDGKIFHIDPDHIDIDPFLSSRFDILSRDDTFWTSLRRNWPIKNPRAPARALIAPVASGSSVISDPDFVAALKHQHRRLAGIDMEIYGLYRSVHLSQIPRPLVMGIKSVCDHADENKDDDFQPYAAYNAAHTTIEFLKRFFSEISAHLSK